MRRRALGTGADVDLENDSEELERFYVGEDGDDIGASALFENTSLGTRFPGSLSELQTHPTSSLS